LISFLIDLLVAALILGFVFWGVKLMPFIPPPFDQVLKGLAAVILSIWLLSILLRLGRHHGILHH
jgi:hypothetical protein